MRHARIALPALLLLATLAHAADDGPFPIKLTRPDKVGDSQDCRFHLDSSIHTTMTPKDPNQPGAPAPQSRDKHIQAYLLCRVDVIEVNPTGHATQLLLTVDKLLLGEQQTPKLERGTQIDVKLTDKSVTFTPRNGSALSDDVSDCLSNLIRPFNSSGIDSDAVMGSKIPRKIGESWPFDSEAAARETAGAITFDPKKFTGTALLRSRQETAGQPCLECVFEQSATDWKPASFSPGDTFVSSKMSSKIIPLIPLDPALPILEWEQALDARITYETVQTAPMIIDVQIHRSLTAIVNPITPSAAH